MTNVKDVCKGAQEKLLGLVAELERTRAALPVSRGQHASVSLYFLPARAVCVARKCLQIKKSSCMCDY
jgi:hypothetical protein